MKLYSVGLWLGLATLVLSGCSSSVENEFVSGCKAEGGDAKLCSCVYKRMSSKISDEGIHSNLNGVPSEFFNEQMISDTVQCVKEQ